MNYEELSPKQKKEHKRLMNWSQEVILLKYLYNQDLLSKKEMVAIRQTINKDYNLGTYYPDRPNY